MFILTKIQLILLGFYSIFSFKTNEFEDEEFKIIDYEVEYVYSEKYSQGEELVIQDGHRGYLHLVNGEEKNAKESINKIVKIGTRENADYIGDLTGYGPDCAGCSKKGYVACSTKDKENWSLIYNGIIYNDDDYGEVSIVAADHSLFPCGTIVEFSDKNDNSVVAIVLDTGATMRNKWRNNNKVHLDLAFENEKDAIGANAKQINYHVKRWGW